MDYISYLHDMKVNNYLQITLAELGLTSGEAEIYLSILKNPNITASELKSGHNYSNAGIYKILNSLSDQGLINVYNKEDRRSYIALPIENLAKKLATRGRKIQRLSMKVKEISSLSKFDDDTEILKDDELTDFYLNIPYKIDDMIWCIGSHEAVVNFFGKSIEQEFINTRIKRRMHANAIIFEDSTYALDLSKRDNLEKRESRIVPINEYPLEFSYLYDDKLLTFYKDDE